MRSLLTFSLALVLSGIAYAGPTITPEEAKNYVGKDVSVTGKCVSVVEKNGNVFLNFVRDYPNQPFYGFVPAKSADRVDAAVTLQSLEGQTCSISGTMVLHKGRPQIVVTDPSQIKHRVQGFPVEGVNR